MASGCTNKLILLGDKYGISNPKPLMINNIPIITATNGIAFWMVPLNENEINPEATVTVKVTSAGKEETVYNEKHRKDTSTIIFDVKGVGTITIKVYVDDVLKRQTQMNLNSSDTFWRAE